MADTGAGGDAGEAGVGYHRHVLAEIEVFESAGDLIGFFHARSGRAAADEDEDIAGFDLAIFDGGDGGFFGGEDAGGAGLAIDAVGVDDGGIDGGGFDNRALRSDVADREADGAGEAFFAGPRRRHDYIVWIDRVVSHELFAKAGAALRFFPPLEHFAQ